MEFDVNHLIEFIPEINSAFLETLYMISIALVVAIIIGLPLGILIFITDKGLFLENRVANQILGFIVNLIRSIPFIILLVALIPLTVALVGSMIGPTAASVSLSVAAIPFFARLVESALREVNYGVIEAAIAAGGTPWMIIKDVILPEAKAGIISGITITIVSLVGTSAVAGTLGGGGIGDLAIRFGYYRYDDTIMITTVIILIIFVQIIQLAGDKIAKVVNKK
ncbi:methionine ABC transporter permease [Oceanobacillus rekensis]|uniref:methionine ABC transporter permease n=1 Tax=Oceanobacillus rekensis TaxID=937927 RepID=UPI000B4342CB|nr:methionine ABC transporter permease [Oceanobacillus rekensis]